MHRRTAHLLTLCLFVTWSAPLSAQTQADLDEQAGGAYRKADAALNQVYDQLLTKVSPAGKDSLRTAQRTWVQFRDQECDFETLGSRDGSIHPMVLAECATRLTEARTKPLRAQLECQEGDAGCGGHRRATSGRHPQSAVT